MKVLTTIAAVFLATSMGLAQTPNMSHTLPPPMPKYQSAPPPAEVTPKETPKETPKVAPKVALKDVPDSTKIDVLEFNLDVANLKLANQSVAEAQAKLQQKVTYIEKAYNLKYNATTGNFDPNTPAKNTLHKEGK